MAWPPPHTQGLVQQGSPCSSRGKQKYLLEIGVMGRSGKGSADTSATTFCCFSWHEMLDTMVSHPLWRGDRPWASGPSRASKEGAGIVHLAAGDAPGSLALQRYKVPGPGFCSRAREEQHPSRNLGIMVICFTPCCSQKPSSKAPWSSPLLHSRPSKNLPF